VFHSVHFECPSQSDEDLKKGDSSPSKEEVPETCSGAASLPVVRVPRVTCRETADTSADHLGIPIVGVIDTEEAEENKAFQEFFAQNELEEEKLLDRVVEN